VDLDRKLLPVPVGVVKPISNSSRQNHSLRYATHQLNIPIGIVASSDHKMGIVKSAISPSTINVAQKTLRSIP
jgi:hypothetical protein